MVKFCMIQTKNIQPSGGQSVNYEIPEQYNCNASIMIMNTRGCAFTKPYILGDSEVTTNIYCKSSNLPNTDTQNYSTDLRYFLGHPV